MRRKIWLVGVASSVRTAENHEYLLAGIVMSVESGYRDVGSENFFAKLSLWD
jgi:hypothetical protein